MALKSSGTHRRDRLGEGVVLTSDFAVSSRVNMLFAQLLGSGSRRFAGRIYPN
jgi:hypothetical protein